MLTDCLISCCSPDLSPVVPKRRAVQGPLPLTRPPLLPYVAPQELDRSFGCHASLFAAPVSLTYHITQSVCTGLENTTLARKVERMRQTLPAKLLIGGHF